MRELGFSVPRLPTGEEDRDLPGRRAVHDGERTADDAEIDDEASPGNGESSDDDETDDTFDTDWARSEDDVDEVNSYQTLQQDLLAVGDIKQMLAYPLYDDLIGTAANCIAS
jgi:hypothetical protein